MDASEFAAAVTLHFPFDSDAFRTFFSDCYIGVFYNR